MKAKWIKELFESESVDVLFITRGQVHAQMCAKVMQLMLERIPGQHYLRQELITPEEKKRRDSERKSRNSVNAADTRTAQTEKTSTPRRC